jgi:hypothetical protein
MHLLSIVTHLCKLVQKHNEVTVLVFIDVGDVSLWILCKSVLMFNPCNTFSTAFNSSECPRFWAESQTGFYENKGRQSSRGH